MENIKKFTKYGFKTDMEGEGVYGFSSDGTHILCPSGSGPLMYVKTSRGHSVSSLIVGGELQYALLLCEPQKVENAEEVMEARNAEVRALLEKYGFVVNEDGYVYGCASSGEKHEMYKEAKPGMISVRAKLDDINLAEDDVIYTFRYENDPTILQRLKDTYRFLIDAEGRIYGRVNEKDLWNKKPFIEMDVFEREEGNLDAEKLWVRGKPDDLVYFDHKVMRFSSFEVVGRTLEAFNSGEHRESFLRSLGHKVVGEYVYGFYSLYGLFKKWSPLEKGEQLGRANIADIIKVRLNFWEATNFNLSKGFGDGEKDEVIMAFICAKDTTGPLLTLSKCPSEKFGMPVKVPRLRILYDACKNEHFCFHEDAEFLDSNVKALKENGFKVDENGWVTGFVRAPICDMTVVHASPPVDGTIPVRILALNAKLTGDKGLFIAAECHLEEISKKQLAIERGFRVEGDWVYGYGTSEFSLDSSYVIRPGRHSNSKLVRFLADNMVIPCGWQLCVCCHSSNCEILTLESFKEFGFQVEDNMVYGFCHGLTDTAYCHRILPKGDSKIYKKVCICVDKIKAFHQHGFNCNTDDMIVVLMNAEVPAVEDTKTDEWRSLLNLFHKIEDGFVYGWMNHVGAQNDRVHVEKVPTGGLEDYVYVRAPIEKVVHADDCSFICPKSDVAIVQSLDALGCINIDKDCSTRGEFIFFGHHIVDDYVYSLYPIDKLPKTCEAGKLFVIPDSTSDDATTWFSQYANPSPNTDYALKYDNNKVNVGMCFLRHPLKDAFPIGDKIKFRAFELFREDDDTFDPFISKPFFLYGMDKNARDKYIADIEAKFGSNVVHLDYTADIKTLMDIVTSRDAVFVYSGPLLTHNITVDDLIALALPQKKMFFLSQIAPPTAIQERFTTLKM